VRAASIKHAEYEILKSILITDFDKLDVDFYSLCGGDPFGDGKGNYKDAHARKRFAKAVCNIREMILKMAQKRIKYLPEEHEDYDADDLKELIAKDIDEN